LNRKKIYVYRECYIKDNIISKLFSRLILNIYAVLKRRKKARFAMSMIKANPSKRG